MGLSARVHALALAGALAAPLCAEDLTLVWKVSGRGDAPGKRTQYIGAHGMRSAEGDKDFIADLSAGKITMIDHRKKEYSETTLGEIEAAMQRASARMREASARMQDDDRDDATRDPRRSWARARAPGLAVSVTKGGTRRIAGYEAQQYTLSLGEAVTTEMWNTKELPLPVQDPGEFRKLAAIGLPSVQGMDEVFVEMKKVEGVSLAQTTRSQLLGRTIDDHERGHRGPQGTHSRRDIRRGRDRSRIRKVPSPLARLGSAPPG